MNSGTVTAPCRQRTRQRTAPSSRTRLWISMLLPRCLTSYSMSLCSAPSAEPHPFPALAASAAPYAPPHTNDTKLGPSAPQISLCGGASVRCGIGFHTSVHC
jgi:hypothetical protein